MAQGQGGHYRDQIGSFETGIASIAAPVRDMSGSVVAAINLTRPVMSEMTDIDAQIRREVINCAMAISRMLGFATESEDERWQVRHRS